MSPLVYTTILLLLCVNIMRYETLQSLKIWRIKPRKSLSVQLCFPLFVSTSIRYATLVLELKRPPVLPPASALSGKVLGRSAYLNWPLMHEAQVVGISDEKEVCSSSSRLIYIPPVAYVIYHTHPLDRWFEKLFSPFSHGAENGGVGTRYKSRCENALCPVSLFGYSWCVSTAGVSWAGTGVSRRCWAETGTVSVVKTRTTVTINDSAEVATATTTTTINLLSGDRNVNVSSCKGDNLKQQ